MSASKARIVYGRRISTPSMEARVCTPLASATKKKIVNDEEFIRSLHTLSTPTNPSPSTDTSPSSDQEDDTILNLSNCKRKHEMLELGSNSKFRDELDFMMQGLECNDVDTILGAMQEIKHKVQSDDDFGSRMRAMGAAQQIFDLIKIHFPKHDNIAKEAVNLFLAMSRNIRRLDFVISRQSWLELLELLPENVEMAKRMVASGMDIQQLQGKDVLLNALVECNEWDMLDACWQDNPDKWIDMIRDIEKVIVSMHLPSLVTISGTKKGPTLIHKHSPNLFQDLLMNDDVASQSILINLLDRPAFCPHREIYADISRDTFDALVIRDGLGAILAMLLNKINPDKCVINKLDELNARINTFIEMLRENGKTGLAEEIHQLIFIPDSQ